MRGEWGSGKTSIKNLVVEVLSAPGQTEMRVVTFNPWHWGADEAITRAFFREISVALGDDGQSPSARRRAHEFRRYARILESLSGGLKNVGTHASSAAGWFAGVGFLVAGGVVWLDASVKRISTTVLVTAGVVLVLSKVVAFFGRDKEDSRPLDVARFDLEQQLKGMPQNILVVIDDIDRLEEEQIRTVIRHVKANASFPGITYLLLYQRAIVERAFGEGEEGKQFLEKIVQTAFDVPVVEGERVGKILLAELEKITASLPDGKFDQTRWGNMWVGGLRHFFRNLRDAKRYIGGVEVQITLHKGERVLETNIIDTIALEALRLFEPDVYDEISRSKALLVGPRLGNDRSDAEKEKLKAVIAKASPHRKEIVQYIVSQMFPRMIWAFGNTWYGNEWETTWSSERRICSRRYFDRYFALRLPDGRISDTEFLNFVDHLGDRASVETGFSDFRARGLLNELLARLDEAAQAKALPIEAAGELLPALFTIGESIPDEARFGEGAFVSAWRGAAWYLRIEEDPAKRSAAFLRALNSSTALAIPAILMSLDMDRKEHHEKDILLPGDLDQAKAIWVGRFRTALENDPESVIAGQHFLSFLYRWRDFESLDGPRAWVAAVAKQPELLSKLLVAFLQTGSSHVIGDYVSKTTLSLHFEAMLPLIDFPTFTNAVRDLSPELGTREDEARTRYLQAAERYAARTAEPASDLPDEDAAEPLDE